MAIYLAAVVLDKTAPEEHTPYVSTALGPYHPDELAALERGKVWLRETYATEDIRRIEPPSERYDADHARGMAINAVHAEWEQRRETARRERAQAALEATQAHGERWEHIGYTDADGVELDTIMRWLAE